MLQLTNRTPFAANFAVLPNQQGLDTVYVNVKASFLMNQKEWQLTEEQDKPQLADSYLDEPASSSVLIASDVHIGKPATDIAVIGNVIPRDGQAVTELQAGIALGSVQKVVRVSGDRVWDGGRISAPSPFESMPMVYERAYGGSEWQDDQCVGAELRNPVGVGYYSKTKKVQDGDPLPNLEDAAHPITSASDKPTPSNLGFIAPNWAPRVNYAGTYDEHWQTTRAPFLPLDFDQRFCNAAHPDLIYPGFVQGGEPLQIANMHPVGLIKTQIPTVNLRCKARVKGQDSEARLNLETLVFMPNELKMTMVWKAAIPVGKRIADVQNITVLMNR